MHLRGFWLCTSTLLIALGLNKQLDVHSQVFDYVCTLSEIQGWYAQRKWIFGLTILITAIAVIKYFRAELLLRSGPGVRMAQVCTICLVAVLGSRFAPISSVENFLSCSIVALENELLNIQLHDILELLLIGLIAEAVRQAWSAKKRPLGKHMTAP
jgi:hypothetical protein